MLTGKRAPHLTSPLLQPLKRKPPIWLDGEGESAVVRSGQVRRPILAIQQAPVYDQPGPTPQMSVKTSNQNAKNLPYDAEGERDWSNGLLSCFSDLGNCASLSEDTRPLFHTHESTCQGCIALWCPCIVYSKNAVSFITLSCGWHMASFPVDPPPLSQGTWRA
jgi:hypothetical protein